MISQLRGVIRFKRAPGLLVDVNGVGYEVLASMNTFCQLPEVEQAICLYTQLIVREDAHTLYGFIDHEERELFRALIRVNGVGPKMALTILSSTSPSEFVQYVVNNDSQRLVKLPGIGKKTAERLIIEMRDRLANGLEGSLVPATQSLRGNSLTMPAAMDEAVSALLALGYKPAEASRAVSLVADADKLRAEDIIRQALKLLAK